jgi:hypothetical protein
VVDQSDQVDAMVVEWLTVLSRRDIALLVEVRTPDGGKPTRALLARFAQWWVVIQRCADLIRVHGAGTATAEGPANAVIAAELHRACGSRSPAPLRPVTLDAGALRLEATSPASLRRFLATRCFDGDQLQMLMSAADSQGTAQASIVAIQCGAGVRAHIGQNAVTIIDTLQGRLLAEHVASAGKTWMIVAPGTASNIVSAVNHMLRCLPAQGEWFGYRRAV